VLLRQGDVTSYLCQLSRVKFAGQQLAAVAGDADVDLAGAKGSYLLAWRQVLEPFPDDFAGCWRVVLVTGPKK
jgi:hypothetical protein